MSVVLKQFKVPALFLALLCMAGCVQTKPVPGYARAGDFIVLGLGGVERNSGGEPALKVGDLDITITDANNVTYPLQAKYVFKSYPDYAAWLNTGNIDGSSSSVGLTELTTFDGGWFAVVPLTVAGTVDSPLPLAVGGAGVSVVSPKLTNIADSVEGDLGYIPIEIMAGVAPYDADYLGQFTTYEETARSFVISPNDLTGIDTVGGALLAIRYIDSSFFRANTEPMVVPLTHNPFVQLNYNHVPNGNGTGTVYVTLLNAAGFADEANATQNTSPLSSLSVKLVYFTKSSTNPKTAEAKASFSIVAAKSYYIDTDGSILAGVSPVLTHYEDL
jgi:hypothetical protein